MGVTSLAESSAVGAAVATIGGLPLLLQPQCYEILCHIASGGVKLIGGVTMSKFTPGPKELTEEVGSRLIIK